MHGSIQYVKHCWINELTRQPVIWSKACVLCVDCAPPHTQSLCKDLHVAAPTMWAFGDNAGCRTRVTDTPPCSHYCTLFSCSCFGSWDFFLQADLYAAHQSCFGQKPSSETLLELVLKDRLLFAFCYFFLYFWPEILTPPPSSASQFWISFVLNLSTGVQ